MKIPFHSGLKGHSDGDVILHAIIDSLLGAMRKSDIGTLFPSNSSKFKNIRSKNLLMPVVKLIKDRSKTITEITSMSEIFFKDKLEYDFDLLNKTFNDKSIAIIKDFQSALSTIEDWSRVEIEKIFEDIMEQHEVAIGQVMKPVRVAISVIPFGPGIFDLILLLGKEICQIRLRHALSVIQ